MANTIKIKRGAEAGLPTLEAGEPGFTTDTKKLFIGDGTQNNLIGPGAAGAGDFVGPAGAVDSNLVAFDTNTGKLGKDSGLSTEDLQILSYLGF